MSSCFLTALPVFNEKAHVDAVLDQVRRFSPEILVIDDGSTDGTAEILKKRDDIHVIRHRQNRGYGGALQTAFDYAIRQEFDFLVTIDCDGQHEPQLIPQFVEACGDVDILSGSRYLLPTQADSTAPEDRRQINHIITGELNQQFGLRITDAFCGFKAYRVTALRRLRLSEDGYAMPLQLWVQAARLGLRIKELPVPRIYLDAKRSFGGALDDAETRLAYYRDVIDVSSRAFVPQHPCCAFLECGEPV